jgi:hypothetical protein
MGHFVGSIQYKAILATLGQICEGTLRATDNSGAQVLTNNTKRGRLEVEKDRILAQLASMPPVDNLDYAPDLKRDVERWVQLMTVR